MDFFGHQERARRRTSWLVVLYGLAVAGIVGAVYLVAAIAFSVNTEDTSAAQATSLWNPELFFWVAIGVLGVVLSGSLFKTLQLSQGGSAVARSLGGRLLPPDSHDAAERRLLNVVEEMALAAGVAVPQVYLLDNEQGINAFAAGFSTRDAAIGVTRGCVEQLTRDELQGVIAHEFSHIVNGDMRLNIRLMGILFGILMLTIVGRILLRSAYFSGGRSRNNDKKGGNPLPFIGLALIIIGYIGVFFANLIKSAVSRQREFLSDASAVQFTRNPSGIAGALKKIGGLSQGARLITPRADEASHLFFGEAVGHGLIGLLATHPPLAERIKRLDPAFNSNIARMLTPDTPSTSPSDSTISGFSSRGHVGTANLAVATSVIQQIPDTLLDEVRDPVGAKAVVYGLLWSEDPNVQTLQKNAINRDPQTAVRLETLHEKMARLPRVSRLPLAELAVPSLRMMTREQFDQFKNILKALTEADLEIDLFEFALSHMILRHVESAFGKAGVAPIRYRTIEGVLPSCSVVLASMAVWGTTKVESARKCYQAGMSRLDRTAAALNPDNASLDLVEKALQTLSETAPSVKKQIIEACTACILEDGNIAIEQTELLRAIADAMDVPMPPLNA